MGDTQAVALDDIVLDERCQPRAILNPEAVQEYADAYREEVALPALEVALVEQDMVLLDGFHRLAGARQADQSFVRVTVVEECDIGRALWLAASRNQKHGVRRTSADKRQATLLALRSDVGQEQSVRTIAEWVGVSKTLVSDMRQELERVSAPDTQVSEPEPPETPHDDEKVDDDMYHTAAKRIKGCYRKVCAILGEEDDVCEQLFRALEMAEGRGL